MPVTYQSIAVDPCGARAGILHTRRGEVETPVFMPVGTFAAVNVLTAEDVAASGAGIVLANTYHLLLRPGPEVFAHFGGIHAFMGWNGCVLTDSGGYQIFSLANDRTLSEEGALFRGPDGRKRLLRPETSIETQQAIGSDIAMVLDVCIDSRTDEAGTRAAMERTHRWAARSLAAHDPASGQSLFAIVQGGRFPALRRESVAALTALDFDGFALGGLAVGEARELRDAVIAEFAPQLPRDKPRYLMGVGTPLDLLESVRSGIDMFDCILPTILAERGYAFTFEGKLRITRGVYRLDDGPLDPACDCPTCARASRGYLHHLAKTKLPLAVRLLALHNVHHTQALMRRLRAAIIAGHFAATYAELREVFSR